MALDVKDSVLPERKGTWLVFGLYLGQLTSKPHFIDSNSSRREKVRMKEDAWEKGLLDFKVGELNCFKYTGIPLLTFKTCFKSPEMAGISEQVGTRMKENLPPETAAGNAFFGNPWNEVCEMEDPKIL